jgi:hypothetical protein
MNIEEAIKQSKTGLGFLNRASMKKAQNMLLPDEQVLYAMNANTAVVASPAGMNPDPSKLKNKFNGVLVITDSRLYFANSVMGLDEFFSLDLDDIVSVMETSGRMGILNLCVQGKSQLFVIECTARTLDELKKTLNQAGVC